MGDYACADVDVQSGLGNAQSITFWAVFMIILILNNIIFLNFVIAEACNSYTIIAEQLDQNIQKARAALIGEAQEVIPF